MLNQDMSRPTQDAKRCQSTSQKTSLLTNYRIHLVNLFYLFYSPPNPHIKPTHQTIIKPSNIYFFSGDKSFESSEDLQHFLRFVEASPFIAEEFGALFAHSNGFDGALPTVPTVFVTGLVSSAGSGLAMWSHNEEEGSEAAATVHFCLGWGEVGEKLGGRCSHESRAEVSGHDCLDEAG